MKLPRVDVYATKKISEDSACGFLKNDGRKVVLKPRKKFIDQEVLHFLHKIEMHSIPHLIGLTEYQTESYLVFSWLNGQPLSLYKLKQEEIFEVIEQVLKLIRLLENITERHWFFLDLKPQHLLLTKNNDLQVIDFEHVFISSKEKIPWKNLKEIGVSSFFSSNEIKGDYLSKKHHEYALALICLSLLAGKDIELLTAKVRKKALANLPEYWKNKLKSALECNGFNLLTNQKMLTSISSKKLDSINKKQIRLADNSGSTIKHKETLSKKTESQSISEVSSDMLETLLPFIQTALAYFQRNGLLQDLKLDIQAENISRNLVSYYQCILQSKNASYSEKSYLHQIDLQDYLDKRQELIVLSNIEIITLCDCHLLPIFHKLNLSFIRDKNLENNYSEIIAELMSFTGQVIPSNILTKHMARFIVKQYGISDLFLYSRSSLTCKKNYSRKYNEAYEAQQIKFGQFTRDAVLCEKAIQMSII